MKPKCIDIDLMKVEFCFGGEWVFVSGSCQYGKASEIRNFF